MMARFITTFLDCLQKSWAASQQVEPVEPEPPAIIGHKLPSVRFVPTENMGGEMTPRFLIIHYTANGSLQGAINEFTKKGSKKSAHLIVDRDGTVVQMVPFNRIAWHAGVSQWGNERSLNRCSIGIELVNWGLLERDVDGLFYSWSSTPIHADEATQVIESDRAFWWHKYTPEQLEVCFNLSRILYKHYGLEEVLGHEDVSPGRKVDPGPLFPMDELREFVKK